MERRTGSFVAHDDLGNAHTIYIYKDRIDAASFEGSAEVEATIRLATANGDRVNRISQGEYQVMYTGLVLKSTDPNAP